MIPNTHLKVMMVMNCPKCGYSCGGGDRFCMKCGTALEVKNLSVAVSIGLCSYEEYE